MSWDDFIKELKSSVLDPVWQRFAPIASWVLGLRWPERVLFLLIVVLLGLLGRELLGQASSAIRGLVTSAPPDKLWRALVHSRELKLTEREAKLVDEEIGALSADLRSELDDASAPEADYDAWGVSQMTVALLGEREVQIDSSRTAALLEEKRNVVCNCWKEYPDDPSAHAASTDWAAFALGAVGEALPSADLRFILNSQNRGGWPPLDADRSSDNASTYATAWSILALDEQLRTEKMSAEDAHRARNEIPSGLTWLIDAKLHGVARWLEHPSAPGGSSQKSIAASALVVHVLHRMHVESQMLSGIDADWMDELPESIPVASAEDSGAYPVQLKSGSKRRDTVRQLQLPWMIIATVDAYDDGGLRQRARALRWLDTMVSEKDLITPVLREPWAASELEIALRYLRHDSLHGRPII